MAHWVFAFTSCLLFLPALCFIPSSLEDDMPALLKLFNVHHITEIHAKYGSNLHYLGSSSHQKTFLVEQAVTQVVFVNHVECEALGTRSSALGAVFYPVERKDQPCDLATTEMLVTGSSVNRPVFLFSFKATLIPRWLHEMYVPFNTSVNIILQDKSEAGWLTLQEVYHLDNNGSNLVVNQLGRREVDTDKETRWRMTRKVLKVSRRANLRGTTIRSLILVVTVQQPTAKYSLFLLEANKTLGMACDFLNASAKELHADTSRFVMPLLVNNSVDLAIHPVSMSGDTPTIDYSAPYSSVRNRIYIRRPVFTYSLRSVVQSFSLSTWAVIGVAIVAMSATTTLTSRVAHGLDLEPHTTWSESVVNTLGSACAQGWSRLPHTKSGRCVLLSTVIAGYLLNTYFVMQLQSGLSAQTAPLPFRGLDELVQTDYQIFTEPRGVASSAIRIGKTEVAKRAREKSITEKDENAIIADSHFCEKRIALITVTSVLGLSTATINCTIIDTKVDLFLASVVFPMRRDYQFKQLIDYSFRRAVEGGLVQRNELLYQGPKTDADDDQQFSVIELDKVEPFLFVYGCALGVSVAIFLLELACFHWCSFWQKVFRGTRFLVRRLRRCVVC